MERGLIRSGVVTLTELCKFVGLLKKLTAGQGAKRQFESEDSRIACKPLAMEVVEVVVEEDDEEDEQCMGDRGVRLVAGLEAFCYWCEDKQCLVTFYTDRNVLPE